MQLDGNLAALAAHEQYESYVQDELMVLAWQLQEERPDLSTVEAHFTAAHLLPWVLDYAAQWDRAAAAERTQQ